MTQFYSWNPKATWEKEEQLWERLWGSVWIQAQYDLTVCCNYRKSLHVVTESSDDGSWNKSNEEQLKRRREVKHKIWVASNIWRVIRWKSFTSYEPRRQKQEHGWKLQGERSEFNNRNHPKNGMSGLSWWQVPWHKKYECFIVTY